MLKKYLATILIASIVISACSKKEERYTDPYAGGMEQIGINFNNTPPTPETGTTGQKMSFHVKGAMEHRDKLTFLANGTKAEIIEVTDSTITVILPDNVSSGGSQLKIGDQVFPGPSFKVRGKLGLDPTFTPGTGANGLISKIVELPNGNFILAGAFNAYQGRGASAQVSSIVQINPTGNYMSALKPGEGPLGSIRSLLRLANGELMIAGYFSAYNKITGMNGIARLNSNASLKTMEVDLYVSPGVSDPSMAKDTVSAFNAGLIGGVKHLFLHDDKITAVGSFSSYGQYFYERSTKNVKLFDGYKIRQLARMHMTGELDSFYNFDLNTKEGLAGANGIIADAIMQDDGKLILVGKFSRFNNEAVNNIVRLNVDGSIDKTFQIGSGTDDHIFTIRYNETTKKIILSGSFKTVNGVHANQLALLNKDGSVDPAFVAKELTGGAATFAGQLSNGLIVVTGSFNSYDHIFREGLMILNPDGTLAQGYNNTGKFAGIVSDMIETKSGIGNLPSVILTGLINTFEGEEKGNLLKLVFSN